MTGEPRRPVAFVNVGQIVSGALPEPIVDGDTVIVDEGRIVWVGLRSEGSIPGRALIVDAAGQTLIPGLIDPHVHPAFGDWVPQLRAIGWMDAYCEAGVTTILSQGSWVDGYPTDPQGMVALGVALQRFYSALDSVPMTVEGAAVSLVDGLTDEHFQLLHDEGIWLLAEIGVRSVVDPKQVNEMVTRAREHGFVSRVHFGPESVPGTSTVTAEMAHVMGADIASHVNGGPTAPVRTDLDSMLEESGCWLELSFTGNHRELIYAARQALASDALDRIMVGSDTPTGAGILPRAILQSLALLASQTDLTGSQAIALATGNTAKAYRLSTGVIEPGRDADVLLLGAPAGSPVDDPLESLERGDIPGVSLVMSRGEISKLRPRGSLPTKSQVELLPSENS